MTEPVIDLLIDTTSTGEEIAVLSEGGRDRDFRRIVNSLRGTAQLLVETLVAEVKRTGQTREQQVGVPASTVLGDTIAAAPVKGVGDTVFAVQLAPTAADAERRADQLAVWEWEIGLEDLPPRLWLDRRFLDLTGTDPQFRDRTGPYGPVDFFRPVVRLRDILHIWQGLKTVKVGDTGSGRFVARTNTGELRQLHWAQRCVDTSAGPRVRGVCRDVTADADPTQMHIDLAETYLIDKLMHLHDRPGDDSPGMFGAVGDITYLNAPTLIRWLTPYIPTIGHGVSTGQTPAIHPESLMKIPGWLKEMRNGPINDVGMTRRGGGGWLEVVFHADILDREAFPTIGVIIVYPGDVSVVEPRSSTDQ
ncbi:GAF domain-containing protein [Nocardia sp. CA-128927]|uniref:GAF domain-containing protein n=1 Tax=Nocardia sp. CA-128927 TaxID=3239975 RepID=UPI003D97C42F